jgi:L,D-transpeptidase catalytic domain
MRYQIVRPVLHARPLFGSLLIASLACDAAPEAGPGEDPIDEVEALLRDEVVAAPSASELASPRAPEAATVVRPPEREPIAIRIARQQLILRAAADPDAAIRGRIPLGEAFEVFAYVAGPECGGKGWGDLGNGAFACLEATRKGGDVEPRELPELRDAELAPFFYAKLKTGQQAPRWKSLAAFQAGADPVDELEPEHDYAFVTRRRSGGEVVLIDDRDRVVREQDITRYRPSRFAGRDLQLDPVPADRVLAWGITWPENPVMSEPSESARALAPIDYQAEIILLPEPTRNREGAWWSIDGGGYIHGRSLRRFQPAAAPEGIGADELWIDVELESQTLTVMRGETPVFTTLVSTGFKGPTPRGLFRISIKQAIGQMQSRADAEEQYNVEAVPFVQYFSGNFALHGAFWHYRFGHKISHGCVNLSPKDARRVYGMTSPEPRGGWLHVYEGENVLGTTVRVRRGDEAVIDKREPVRLFTG